MKNIKNIEKIEKTIIIIVLILILLFGIYKIYSSIKANIHEPIFLELEYLGSVPAEPVKLRISLPEDAYNITWWEYLGLNEERLNDYIEKNYNAEIEFEIDYDTYAIVISYGRELKQLYYYEDSKIYSINNAYICRPAFKEDYYHNTLFVYQTIDEGLYISDNLFDTYDLYRYNIDRDIPYKV